MRLTNKVIEQVVENTAGQDVLPLVTELKHKKNYSEFKLAETLRIEVNQVRNMLYRLLKYNLVTFIRRKDKRKGWYIYYWTFRLKQIKNVLRQVKKERIEKLRDRLQREKQEQFFTCSHQCMRMNFEKATDFMFKCPECGELLYQEDNSGKIKAIENEIKELDKQLRKKE
jgi:transcription initiation factor TFIIE subunit alpha